MKKTNKSENSVAGLLSMTESNRRNFLVMNVQLMVSLVSTIIISRLYFPEIFQTEFSQAVLPVSVFHMFRFLGMTLLMPGQMDSQISYKAKLQISIGDLAVAVSAVMLTFFIAEGYSDTLVRTTAWIFVIVCLIDMANIQRFFFKEKWWNKEMGTNWLLQVLLGMPMLLGEFFVLYLLITGN